MILKVHKRITKERWPEWWVRLEVEPNPRVLKKKLWRLEFLSEKINAESVEVEAEAAPVHENGHEQKSESEGVAS